MYTTETLTHAVMQLSESEKKQLFELLTNYPQIIDKLMPGLPMITHVLKQQHLNHPLAAEYNQWLNTKT